VSSSRHHIPRYLILLPLLFSAPTIHAERTFRWVDENGQVHYGDRVPPQYLKQERRELNEQGRTLKVYEAPKTPEQKAEERRLAVTEAAREKIAAKQQREDQTLLATYSSEEDMLLARDGKIASIETLIQLTHRRIKSMQKRLLELTDEAAEYERSGKKLPVGLQQQIANIRKQISQNELFIEEKEREMEDIREKFATDIERFKELTADDKNVKTARKSGIKTKSQLQGEAGLVATTAGSTKLRRPRDDIKLTPHDRTLLATYQSEDSILRARNEKIGPVDAGIRETKETIDSLQGDLAELVQSADEYENIGQQPPETLLQKMQGVLDDIAKNEATLALREQEKREIEGRFDRDLARFLEITVEN
jgi:chromosome segregation ATPase